MCDCVTATCDAVAHLFSVGEIFDVVKHHTAGSREPSAQARAGAVVRGGPFRPHTEWNASIKEIVATGGKVNKLLWSATCRLEYLLVCSAGGGGADRSIHCKRAHSKVKWAYKDLFLKV